jgi:hypothetical protein
VILLLAAIIYFRENIHQSFLSEVRHCILRVSETEYQSDEGRC